MSLPMGETHRICRRRSCYSSQVVLIVLLLYGPFLGGCAQTDTEEFSYYDNGNLWQSFDPRTGIRKTYYPNGKLRCQSIKSSADDPNAIARIAVDKATNKVIVAGYEKETCYDERNFPLRDGILRGYLLDGTFNSEIPYKNGKPNGIGRYVVKGKIVSKVIYKDGLQISILEYKEGKPSLEQIYTVGEEVAIREYAEAGQSTSTP